MRRRDSNSTGLFSSADNSDNDCEDEMGTSCGESDFVCICDKTCPNADILKCEYCGKNRVAITRYSEGYGTEEDCVHSDPQGESDADADIEDTDSRWQEAGSLHRVSSRRRRRPRITRQDTTESEDDGGRSHRTHRWSLRLSPQRAPNRTILEESVSQVRPLVLCRPSAGEGRGAPIERPTTVKWFLSFWLQSLSLPLIALLFLPLSLSVIIIIVSFLLPLVRT